MTPALGVSGRIATFFHTAQITPLLALMALIAMLQARVKFLMNRLRLAAVAGRLDETWPQSVNASLQPHQGR